MKPTVEYYSNKYMQIKLRCNYSIEISVTSNHLVYGSYVKTFANKKEACDMLEHLNKATKLAIDLSIIKRHIEFIDEYFKKGC
jgi:hypothetical protein